MDALTYLPTPSVPASTHNMDLRERNQVTYTADIELQPGSSLTSSEQRDLELYHDHFKTNAFQGYQADGLPSHTYNVFVTEQDGFLKTCTKIHVSKVPENANVISTHVMYKIKELDDGSRICKARIARHGNKDKETNSLRTDSVSCPPLGMRVPLSLCTLLKFYVSKIDIKAAFLQSGKAMRDMFVIPPREFLERSFY